MLNHLQTAYDAVGPWDITYTMLVDFLGNQTWAPETRPRLQEHVSQLLHLGV